ncbi:hypothetical protein PR002_g17989 [Phytophthora rubi]|uniref:N-acetyltransferase domain-containing protein n=1 Tax=Phytophthora rubi TaxID=129364 RepID=A0A6A3K6G1_9STRA|nr:hypothetical protein PR002_g17989 [Phytophthora rubi]
MDYLENVSVELYDGYFVDLFVRVSNLLAIGMYEKFGYSVYRRVLGYYSSADDGEDAFDMRKALPRDVHKKSILPLQSHPISCSLRVGKAGDTFEVKIDDADKICTIKEAIQKKKPDTIQGEPDKLKLFLAKTEDGKWLLEKSDVGKKLEGGETTPEVKKMIAENEMMPSWKIQDVLTDFKMTGELAPSSKQIHVLVVLPDQQRSGSTKKQQGHKGMTAAEASRCGFLFEVAQNLAKLYDFYCMYGDDFPRMADIFKAVENGDWKFRLKGGKQLTAVALHNYFTEDQWLALMQLDWKRSNRIHGGKVGRTSEGKRYLVLTHAIATRRGIDIFKDIATKAGVVGRPTEFEVTVEDEFCT